LRYIKAFIYYILFILFYSAFFAQWAHVCLVKSQTLLWSGCQSLACVHQSDSLSDVAHGSAQQLALMKQRMEKAGRCLERHRLQRQEMEAAPWSRVDQGFWTTYLISGCKVKDG
jgi:hypothetical protein